MVPDAEPRFRIAQHQNILALHKFRLHNVPCAGRSKSLWALDEFVSSTLLLWWIRRNLSRLRFFLGAARAEMRLTLRYFFNKITRFRRYTGREPPKP